MQPCIILSQPQMGENIGAAARAMANFGLENLRLIAPRDGWPNQKAIDMAAGANSIIENTKVFESFNDAVADLEYLYAASARPRDMVKPIVTPAVAASDIANSTLKTGIIFGPERTGLLNPEISRCDKIITIPVNPDFHSINLAQSVCVIAYELLQKQYQGESETVKLGKSQPASREEFEGLMQHLEAELAEKDFFKSPNKRPGMMTNIRNTWLRAQLTDQDVRTMRGIIKNLAGKI